MAINILLLASQIIAPFWDTFWEMLSTALKAICCGYEILWEIGQLLTNLNIIEIEEFTYGNYSSHSHMKGDPDSTWAIRGNVKYNKGQDMIFSVRQLKLQSGPKINIDYFF